MYTYRQNRRGGWVVEALRSTRGKDRGLFAGPLVGGARLRPGIYICTRAAPCPGTRIHVCACVYVQVYVYVRPPLGGHLRARVCRWHVHASAGCRHVWSRLLQARYDDAASDEAHVRLPLGLVVEVDAAADSVGVLEQEHSAVAAIPLPGPVIVNTRMNTQSYAYLGTCATSIINKNARIHVS